MDFVQIIIFILLLAIAGFITFCIISFRAADKQADKYDVVGITVEWQKSKIPFIGRIVIVYTRKGKPYQAGTGFMLKPKFLKLGAKNRWTVYTYHFKDKPAVSKAKRFKNH